MVLPEGAELPAVGAGDAGSGVGCVLGTRGGGAESVRAGAVAPGAMASGGAAAAGRFTRGGGGGAARMPGAGEWTSPAADEMAPPREARTTTFTLPTCCSSSG